MTAQSATDQSARAAPLDALSIITALWAAQTLVQLTSQPNSTGVPQTVGWFAMVNWAGASTVAGWLAFAFAIAALLRPTSLKLLLALMVAATVHYISDWPFVSNHLILDTLISLTIIGAAISVLRAKLFSTEPATPAEREAIVGKLSPVVIAMFMLMYFFIVISKMNEGFFDPQISCMQAMYSSFQSKDNMLALVGSLFSENFLFWLFMVVEWGLPIMLMIRKTRLLAIYIGVPFHLLLGLMGHYWYSSLVLTLYAIVALPAIMAALPRAVALIGEERLRLVKRIFQIYVVVTAAVFIATAVLAPDTGLLGYRLVVLNWAAVAGLTSLTIVLCVALTHFEKGPLSVTHTPQLLSAAPGALWLVVLVMCLNSLSPYLGYKTTNSVAMYSNMRTERGENNHYFMPHVALFNFQNDVVEVLSSNNPAIAKLRGWPVLYGDPQIRLPVFITYFELRRAVSSNDDPALWVRYKRNGQERLYDRSRAQSPDADLAVRYPLWLEKTAMFRPIFKDRPYCLH